MWSKKKRCGSLGDQDLDCGACKQLRGEVGSSLRISRNCFMSSILLLVVVMVILVVIVVVIVGVVIVVTIVGVVVEIMIGSPTVKASTSFSVFGTMFGHKTANSWNLLTPGDPIGLFYSNRLGVCIPLGQGIIGQGTSRKCHSVFLDTLITRKYQFRGSLGPVFLLGLSAFAMAAACASRAASGDDVVDLTGDEDLIDGDTGMGDSTGVSMSLGGEISSGGKKSQESNIGGGEIDREDKISLVKSSEESGEMFSVV
ncbi:hypothetical protein Tco_0529241 [Tanacetum coccineum]